MQNENTQDRAHLDDEISALLRVALTAAVTRRPVLGLGGPVTKVTLASNELGPQLIVESALSMVGLRRLDVRLLPAQLDRATLERLSGVGDDPASTTLLIPPQPGAPQDTAIGLRDLTHAARLTETPEELAAVLKESNAGFGRSAQGGAHAAARRILTDLHEGVPTASRQFHLHKMLQRIQVPRPAELARVRQLRTTNAEDQEDALRLHERAQFAWPDPFVHLVVDADPVRPPQRVVTIPGLSGPAENVTRFRELAYVAEQFADTRRPARVALVAESGMGKSSFAARVCRELAASYQVVGWLTATDAATWASSRASLAGQLGLADDAPEALWTRLAECAPALVVLDDAPGPSQFAVLPELPGVHWIVTSQSLDWRAAASVLELAALPLSEATEYLLARTGARAEDLVAAVAELLGGFPLVLEQAAVAITEGVSMSGWLDRHRSDPSYSAAALADIWRIRLTQLAAADPDAGALLCTLACAGSAPLPARLLTVLSDDFPEPTLGFAKEATRRDAAVAALRRQGLIRTGVDTETFQMHPLMARIVRDELDFDVADTAMRVGGAASWLMEAYNPEDVSTWPIVASLVSAAVMACTLVFQVLDEDGYRGLPERAPMALADCALWPAATHLANMGANSAAYRTRLLALALYGDQAAAKAVRSWSGVVNGLFKDLELSEVIPASELGRVEDPEAKLLAARWINENAPLISDRSLALALSYAERALELVPRSLPSAGTVGARGQVPWTTEIRVEILDNLGFLQLLNEDFEAADRTYATALRLWKSRPGAEQGHKYGELLNDRALVLLDRGMFTQCRTAFDHAAQVIRSTLGPDAAMLDGIENNLALTEHRLWHLRPARIRLQAGLDRLWDRLDHRDSDVIIHQCNTGAVLYDLGETARGLQLIEGAWRTLAERLGEDDRETRIRFAFVTRLRQYRGDLAAVLAATNREIATLEREMGADSPYLAIGRLAAAQISGLAALTPSSVESLTASVISAFQGVGTNAAMGWDARAAHVLAGEGAESGEHAAEQAVRLYRNNLGGEHPAALLAEARLALVRQDRVSRKRRLISTGARRLLTTLDSITRPGVDGFCADLAHFGQAPIDLARPGWEADRIEHLLGDGLVDLDPGERLVWEANAGRLAVLAGRNDFTALRATAEGSRLLYGRFHPWTLLRQAAAAIACDDRDELRFVLTVPYWP